MNRQSVTIDTNDPLNRQVRLTVQSDIDLQIDSDPRRLWFGIVKDQSAITKSCRILGSQIETVIIKNIRLEEDVSPNVYTWQLSDQRATGKGMHLSVTFHPANAVPGRFLHQLILDTNLPDTPEFIVNLAGELFGSLYSVPQRVLFSNYQNEIETIESVIIRTHQEIPFRITSVDSLDAEVTVVIASDKAQLEHSINIVFKPHLDRPRLQTQVKITTDLDVQPELLLDIHGFQRREKRKLSL